MASDTTTSQEIKLAKALESRGLKPIRQYDDNGYKHVDIYIPEGELFIEVDGFQHYENAQQIESDLQRNYYSDKENRYTLHIPNFIIDTELDKVVEAIIGVVANRELKALSKLSNK